MPRSATPGSAGVGWYAVDRVVAPGDVALVLALLLAIAGLVAYPVTPGGARGLARMVLDGLVLGGSLLVIANDTVMPLILGAADTSLFRQLAPAVAPVFELVLATVTVLMLLRAPRADRLPLALAGTGFGLLAVADVISGAYRAEHGVLPGGTLVDLGWIAGFTLIAIGVRWSRSPGSELPRNQSGLTSTVVMFGLFLAAMVLHLTRGGATLAGGSSLLLVAVLLSVAVRQALVIRDNDGLRRDLERRVRERSTELAEVTQRTDLLVDSVGDGVYGVDDRGLVTFVNPAAALALGYRPRELLGREAHSLFHDHAGLDPQSSAEGCYVSRVLRTGGPVSAAEDVYLARDGRRLPVEVTASPLARDIRARGAVVVFRDVTQRREVDRLKNEFVSMVSHELKTPLTAIRGSLGLLAGGALGELPSAATRMVEIAMDSSERLTRMINQILDLERIESGTLPIELGEHDADKLVRTAAAELGVLAEQAGVRIVVGRTDGVVLADVDQVERTLVNLIGNAVKFSPGGQQVVVEAVAREQQVEFSVADSGRGIPEDHLEAIFTRFHQVDSSDARDKGGTGLGLAISRSMVERLGGRLWAANRPEGGALFRFTLPRVHDQQPPVARDGVRPPTRTVDRPPVRPRPSGAVGSAEGRPGR